VATHCTATTIAAASQPRAAKEQATHFMANDSWSLGERDERGADY
jgi:hypothetical protein